MKKEELLQTDVDLIKKLAKSLEKKEIIKVNFNPSKKYRYLSSYINV